MIWALIVGLCIAMFAVLEPMVGGWGALAGIGVCFLGAIVGGGPFVLYTILRDRK